MEKEKPIGVFDSGIGGLTVVKRLASALPEEDLVYFGDTARVPYGSKSNETVIEYSLQDCRFLINKNVKAIVVACNTASSVALDEIKKAFSVPVIGMIEPGAKYAAAQSKNKNIGVIGTRTTVNNKAYSKEISKIDKAIQVVEKACPLFVPLAEEGWLDHKATYEIAKEYLKELKETEIDTLVLGCTHYPLLWNVIQKVIGKKVKLIDSGIASAEMVKTELDRHYLHTNRFGMGHLDIYVSDIPVKFKKIAEMFLGRSVSAINKVDIDSFK